MVDSTQGVSEPTPTEGTQESSGPDKGGPSAQPTKRYIANMEQLRTEEPELYNLMMNSMAQDMCKKMKEADDRIKKARKEYEKR